MCSVERDAIHGPEPEGRQFRTFGLAASLSDAKGTESKIPHGGREWNQPSHDKKGVRDGARGGNTNGETVSCRGAGVAGREVFRRGGGVGGGRPGQGRGGERRGGRWRRGPGTRAPRQHPSQEGG